MGLTVERVLVEPHTTYCLRVRSDMPGFMGDKHDPHRSLWADAYRTAEVGLYRARSINRILRKYFVLTIGFLFFTVNYRTALASIWLRGLGKRRPGHKRCHRL